MAKGIEVNDHWLMYELSEEEKMSEKHCCGPDEIRGEIIVMWCDPVYLNLTYARAVDTLDEAKKMLADHAGESARAFNYGKELRFDWRGEEEEMIQANDDYVITDSGMYQRDLKITAKYDVEYLRKRYEGIDANVVSLSLARLRIIEAFVPFKGTLLDFGCGTCRFVEAAVQSGWDAWGYDIAPWPHERKCRCEIRDGGWDVACFFDSAEHLASPKETILSLNARWIMISVPWMPTKIDGWRHARKGEHIWSWDEAMLKTMMDRIGYEWLMTSRFEDNWRPNAEQKEPNILSCLFKRR